MLVVTSFIYVSSNVQTTMILIRKDARAMVLSVFVCRLPQSSEIRVAKVKFHYRYQCRHDPVHLDSSTSPVSNHRKPLGQ